MTERIAALTPDTLNKAQAHLYDQIAGGPRAAGPQHFALTAENGALRGPFNAMLLAPKLGTAVQELGSALRYRGALHDQMEHPGARPKVRYARLAMDNIIGHMDVVPYPEPAVFIGCPIQ